MKVKSGKVKTPKSFLTEPCPQPSPCTSFSLAFDIRPTTRPDFPTFNILPARDKPELNEKYSE
jgi:hypothetical protein